MQLDTIYSGNAAFNSIIGIQPDLVLLGVNLPFVSGIEIWHQIRANNCIAKTKVIVATANARAAEQIEAEGSADIVLVKPLRVPDIIASPTGASVRAN